MQTKHNTREKSSWCRQIQIQQATSEYYNNNNNNNKTGVQDLLRRVKAETQEFLNA